MENSLKIHIYKKQNHFAVHVKLTQYCKSTILQLKKKRTLLYFSTWFSAQKRVGRETDICGTHRSHASHS